VSFRIDGKTALVTGASSGLGAHLATVSASAGAHVLLTARRDEPLLRLAEIIAKDGGTCSTTRSDITDVASVAAIEPMISGFDTLVNNAGVVRDGAAFDQDEAD
jgi:hypothetical protein